MPTIISVHDSSLGLEAATQYIHSKWGSSENYNFYHDAITHASSTNKLPQFYLLIDDDLQAILGCSALLTNDLISRQDLYPYMACLFVEEQHRGKSLGNLLSEHAVKQAHAAGFPTIYLTTNHIGYYEKYGWTHHTNAYNTFETTPCRIYTKPTHP